MDSTTGDIISYVLQLLILIFTFISSYRAGRKMVSQTSRNRKKKELMQTVEFILKHIEDSNGKLKSQDEMLREMYAHYKFSSGSGAQNSE